MVNLSSHKTILLILFSTIIFILLSNETMALSSPERLFNKGQDCERNLYSSKKKLKYRHNWERCIYFFDLLLKRNPDITLSKEALIHLLTLHEGLYKWSRDPNEKTLIQEYSQKIAEIETDAKSNPVLLKKIRYWSHEKFTRVVLDLGGKVKYIQSVNGLLFNLNLINTKVGEKIKNNTISINDDLVKEISISKGADQNDVQIVLSFGNYKRFRVVPYESPDRLVIDVFGERKEMQVKEGSSTNQNSDLNTTPSPNDNKEIIQVPPHVPVIIIDAGHGGKDPGAIGKTGLNEKDVVLDIALLLKNLIDNNMVAKVIMTRKSDKFISLEERTRIANSNNADLFISIHANSNKERERRGIEIYLVGQPSDEEARKVAIRENSSSENGMNELENILNDLLQTNKINESLELAYYTKASFVSNLNQYNIIDRGVKRAPFYVLINAEMPSILAEVSFISNPYDEKMLRSKEYRNKIANAIFNGVKKYISSKKGEI